jgi:hypothetical protein
MYDESLLQTLYGILTGTNAAATRRQYIGDFNTFILNHIPYAQVQLRDLQTGLMSFDGPDANGVDKPLLVWHFGGLPYPIVKAAQVDYTYVRTWDGSGWTIHSSILFGFQSSDDQPLHVSPRARAAKTPEPIQEHAHKSESKDFVEQLTEAVRSLTETSPSATVGGTTVYTDLDSFINDELDGRYASFAADRVAPATPDSEPAIQQRLARVITSFSQAQLPAGESQSAVQPRTPAVEPAVTTALLELLVQVAQQSANGNHAKPRGWVLNGAGPVNVEFDGPARDNDSHHIFAYTTETLFNDQDKYNQVLWWYFAGQPVRITKALRIPVGADPNGPSLFVGYSGPGGHP